MSSQFFSDLAKLWQESRGEFLSSLAGAALGAGGAYLLQDRVEKRKTLEANQGAIVRAQLALMTMLNTVLNLQRQHLDEHRVHPQRSRLLKAFWQAGTQLQIDYNALSFLLLTPYANTVQNVYIADRGYATSIDALNVRNAAYFKLFDNGTDVTIGEGGKARLKADQRDIVMLDAATDSLYKSVDNSARSLEAAISELRDAGKRLFPGMKFLKYDLKDAKPEKSGDQNMPDRRASKDQTCHEWTRHYDTIQWTVMALLLTAAGALLIYTSEKGKFWSAIAASLLVLLSIFFNASFRRLRRKVHAEFSGEEKEWVHRIIRNDGILRQGRVSYGAQWIFFLVIVIKMWLMAATEMTHWLLLSYVIVGSSLAYYLNREAEKGDGF